MFSDRRNSPRRPRLIKVILQIDGSPSRATTVDLSGTGAFVATRAACAIDQEVRLLCRAPGENAFAVQIVARVARIVAAGAGPQPGIGLEFVSARCPNHRDLLARFLQVELGITLAEHEPVEPYRFGRVLALAADPGAPVTPPARPAHRAHSAPARRAAPPRGPARSSSGARAATAIPADLPSAPPAPRRAGLRQSGLSRGAGPASGAYAAHEVEDSQPVRAPRRARLHWAPSGGAPPVAQHTQLIGSQARRPSGGRTAAPPPAPAAPRERTSGAARPAANPRFRPVSGATRAAPPSAARRQSGPQFRASDVGRRRSSGAQTRAKSGVFAGAADRTPAASPPVVDPSRPLATDAPPPSEEAKPLLRRFLASTSKLFGGAEKLVRGGQATSNDGRFFAPGTGQVPDAGDPEAIARITGGSPPVVTAAPPPIPLTEVPFISEHQHPIEEPVTLEFEERFLPAEARFVDSDTLIIVGQGSAPEPGEALWLHLALREERAWRTTYLLGGLRQPAVPVTEGWCAEFVVSSVRTPEEQERFRRFALGGG